MVRGPISKPSKVARQGGVLAWHHSGSEALLRGDPLAAGSQGTGRCADRMAEQQINILVIEFFNSGSSIPGSDVFYGAILDAGALGQKPVETRPADKLDPRGEGGSV